MSIFPFGIFKSDTQEDMARKSDINEVKVDAYVTRLIAAGSDSAAYELVSSELFADNLLSVAELQAIALRYRGGGKKPTSKKAALSGIATRFAEIVRFHKNNKIAERVRPL